MKHALLAALLTCSSIALADEVVNSAPSAAQLGRYSIVRTADSTARFDSATGGTWYLCANKKSKQGWCKAKDIASLPSGPVGRYKLIEGAPLILIDTVTGRSWQRCDMPTPEKGLAWCALED